MKATLPLYTFFLQDFAAFQLRPYRTKLLCRVAFDALFFGAFGADGDGAFVILYKTKVFSPSLPRRRQRNAPCRFFFVRHTPSAL
jgi:hypothetical protein